MNLTAIQWLDLFFFSFESFLTPYTQPIIPLFELESSLWHLNRHGLTTAHRIAHTHSRSLLYQWIYKARNTRCHSGLTCCKVEVRNAHFGSITGSYIAPSTASIPPRVRVFSYKLTPGIHRPSCPSNVFVPPKGDVRIFHQKHFRPLDANLIPEQQGVMASELPNGAVAHKAEAGGLGSGLEPVENVKIDVKAAAAAVEALNAKPFSWLYVSPVEPVKALVLTTAQRPASHLRHCSRRPRGASIRHSERLPVCQVNLLPSILQPKCR